MRFPDIGACPDRSAINHDLNHPARCPRCHLRRSFFVAWADWNGAQWGGSPEAVAASIPGATSNELVRTYEWNGQQLYPLVVVPITVGKTELTANLLFDDTDRFVGVVASPANFSECPAIGTALEAEYGGGEDFGNDFAVIREWIGSGNAMRLTHVEEAGICNLFVAPVAAG